MLCDTLKQTRVRRRKVGFHGVHSGKPESAPGEPSCGQISGDCEQISEPVARIEAHAPGGDVDGGASKPA